MNTEMTDAIIAVETMDKATEVPSIPVAAPLPEVKSEATQRFELMQRKAKLLATSTLIPEAYRGNIGNTYIACSMAARLNIDEFQFMSKCSPVNGRPCIEATLAIAAVNLHGPYVKPIEWKHEGRNTEAWSCVAYGTRADGTIDYGPVVSVAMAKAKGWYAKNDNWKTLTELMLQYRSASWLVRMKCPEVLCGLPFRDELIDEFGQKVMPKNRSTLNETLDIKPEPLTIELTSTKPSEGNS